MKTAAVLLLTLGLAACGGSYLDSKHAKKPEPVPEAGAADWRPYGHQDDADVSVSYASIGHKDKFGPDDYVYVWVWRAFKKDQSPKDGDDYRTEYTRFALDCSKSTIASIAIERRDADDKRVMRRDLPGYQWEFDTIPGNTYMQDFFHQVCTIAHKKETGTEDGAAAPADRPADDAKPADKPAADKPAADDKATNR
jgi:hypothetical protein